MDRTRHFYDDIAELYHLVYGDWDASIDRQADILADLIAERWPGSREVLDAMCGIGTQALDLAARPELAVTASDLSPGAVVRAGGEAERRGVSLALAVCDLREIAEHHQRTFDVLACDNALPHLLSDEEILAALEQAARCTRSGGGLVVSVRDYDAEPRGRGLFYPFGVREEDDERWFVFQVWDFDPPADDGAARDAPERYDFTMYFVPESDPSVTRTSRSRYYAIPPDRLVELVRQAGFRDVERRDDLYFQPLILGTRA